MFSGSRSPGTCTRMRSAPCRWIEASRVPSSSIRRRTTSNDWSIADWASSLRLAPVGQARRGRPRPCDLEVAAGASGTDRERVQLLDRGQGLLALRGVGQGQRHRVALHAEPAVADRAPRARRADVADHVLQALAVDRRQVDLEQQVGAALEVQPERDLPLRQPSGKASRVDRDRKFGSSDRTPSRRRRRRRRCARRASGASDDRRGAASCP